VVRHSGARTVTINVTAGADEVTAEVADDGVGPAWSTGPGSGPPGPGDDDGDHGSGLTGLTERARNVGAEISAGEGRGGKGFRLLVRVPAGRFSAS
jgi:two-component system sensor histidine kinase DesK